MYVILNSVLFAVLFTASPPDIKLRLLPFIFNLTILCSLFTLVSWLGGKILLRITNIIITLIFVAMQIKFKFQNDYTYFWDINLMKDAIKMAGNFKSSIINFEAVFVIATILLLLYLIDKLQTYDIRKELVVLSGFIIVAGLSTYNSKYSLEEVFESRGKIFGFIRSYGLIKESYASEKELKTVTGSEIPDIAEKLAIIDKSDLDIIIIQSETFYDIMRLEKEGIKVAEDVNKNFREYQKEGIHGKVYVPVVGGMTCNSEFDMLTGISSRLFQKGSIVYTGYMKKETDSLTWRLKENGYKTTAIHDYESSFWERDRVYPLLGFDDFISIESFNKPEKYDHWVSDKEVFKKTLETLDSKQGNQLIFTVTVQNHAPFSYKSEKDLVNVEGFSQKDTKSMENYVSGLKISDIALKDFMEELRKRDKNTLVVFYGDHQPSMEHEYFKTMKFFQDEKNRYETDYFIWYNKSDKLPKKQEDTSLISLGNKVKELLGITTIYDRYVMQEFGGLNRDKFFNIKYGEDTLYYRESFGRFNNKYPVTY